MSKIGRNDSCPSGSGAKFKKCLRTHPELSPQSSAGAIWCVCERWQAEEPDLGEVYEAWLRSDGPSPDKDARFLERIFAEPVTSIDWGQLLKNCRAKQHPDLPGLYRRMNASLSGVEGPEPTWLQGAAAELFQDDHPEMFAEILAATLALDPANTAMESLEGIVAWACREERPEDCERLRKHFREFPEYMLEEENQDPEEPADSIEDDKEEAEPEFPPEVERRLDEAWDGFKKLKSPTPADAEALVETLLDLPHSATDWCDAFSVLREVKHPEIFRLFDRLVSVIGSSGGHDLSFVAWGAMEEAVRRNEPERLSEISRSLLRLDAANFDADALSHVEDYLLAHGLIDECLELKEPQYVALCNNDDLFDWVVRRAAVEIFVLRLGKLVATGGLSGTEVEPILAGLADGIGDGDGIDEDLTGRLIRRLLDGPDGTRSKQELQLPVNDDPVDRQQERWVALQAVFVEAAKGHEEATRQHPGRTLVGLLMIERAAYRWIETRRDKKRKFRRNLLDYLDPHNIERQVSMECQEFMGVNQARAHLMLDAHSALARWAEKEGILPATDTAKIAQKLDALLRDAERDR